MEQNTGGLSLDTLSRKKIEKRRREQKEPAVRLRLEGVLVNEA